MGFITYGQEIGIFSENFKNRLDIGTKAMKKKQKWNHNSWATRLQIKRLDGPSEGDVEDTHVIGVFTEGGTCRLDIGRGSMKDYAKATHLVSATRLHIWPHTENCLPSKNGERLQYGDIIGIFDQNGDYRLDLGKDCVPKPCPDNRDSWATRLRIQDKDPVIEVGAIRDIIYNTKDGTILSTEVEEMYNVDLPNSTNIEQTFELSKTFTWSETKTFQNSVGFKIGTEVSGKVGIPFVVEGDVKVSAETSYSHEWGTSETETKSISWKASPVAEPNTSLKVLVTISKSKVEVPYTMTADVKHMSGKWGTETFNGIFKGNIGHDFTYTLEDFDADGKAIGPATTPNP